ncbi:hypothetical protein CQW23_21505 [Capsicum baccatum]|uniref:RING-CH-type domain-containing protein n=1 Tax=Capsicum baccatum TaxID=33114 RepID=A0A2G2VY78_CAPBA|nr:hypothetical protein CQW23_21505 [Capsicum baccatum]
MEAVVVIASFSLDIYLNLLFSLLITLFPFSILRSTSDAGRDFIAPCKCRDTSKHVHRECLDQWRAVKFSLYVGDPVYNFIIHSRYYREVLDFCEEGIILKLIDWMIVASGGAYDTKNAYARECWGLLPAFCCCPSDLHKKAQALTTLLIPFLKESSFMLENISAALQELVNKNKNVLASDTLSKELISTKRRMKILIWYWSSNANTLTQRSPLAKILRLWLRALRNGSRL